MDHNRLIKCIGLNRNFLGVDENPSTLELLLKNLHVDSVADTDGSLRRARIPRKIGPMMSMDVHDCCMQHII